jgi:hypothetical protein
LEDDMGKNIFALACFSLLAAACGSSVDVGGPRNKADAGSGGSSAGHGGSVTTSPGGTPSSANGGTNSTQTETPDSAASTQPSCTTDDDCCIVADSCTNRAYLVGKDQQSHVRKLIDAESNALCTGCIPPFVEVSCQNSRCVGTVVPFTSRPDSALAMDHCGRVADSSTSNPGNPAGGAPSDAPESASNAGAPTDSAAGAPTDSAAGAPAVLGAPARTIFGCGAM